MKRLGLPAALIPRVLFGVVIIILAYQTLFIASKLQDCSPERQLNENAQQTRISETRQDKPIPKEVASSAQVINILQTTEHFKYHLPQVGPVCSTSITRPEPEPSEVNRICRYPCNDCRVRSYPHTEYYSAQKDQDCVPPLASIPFAEESWQLILSNQYPTSCKGKKYLTWAHDNHGIGADIHQAGWALAMAMEHDRILVFNPKAKWIYADEHICKASGFGHITPGGDCYFRPISNCSLPDNWEATAIAVPETGIFPEEPQVLTFHYIYQSPRQNLEAWIPKQIRQKFFSRLTEKMMDEWLCNPYLVSEQGPLTLWRASSIRLFLQPNDYFQQKLNELEQGLSLVWGVNMSSPDFCSIAMHVRHGDKGTESPLRPFSAYMDAATRMRKEHAWLRKCPYVFLSTEDPTVITAADKLPRFDADGLEWRFLYTPTPRFSETMSPMDIAKILGPSRMFTFDFFNLVVTKRASAFILTLSSNWSRMINLMRLVDGRWNMPIADLEYGSW